MNLIPDNSSVTPLGRKLSDLDTEDAPADWYRRAAWILRGGDGGEHGLLLYKLVRSLGADRSHVILDVGTARGFSAVTMARALLDASLPGHVYTIDIIDHLEPVNWHSDTEGKQDPDEPLAKSIVSRSEIWSRWFADEANCITPMLGRSHDILGKWSLGPIDVAFIDGEHTHRAVRRDLHFLERLMAPGGVIVLDDCHTGVRIGALPSRPVNVAVRLVGFAARHLWPSVRQKLPLGTGNEYLVVKRRYAGVFRAVSEFLIERNSEWAIEIVSLPPKGRYHEADYSLALLTKT